MYRYIGTDGKEYGPFEAEEIKRLLAEGRLTTATRVVAEGTTEWKPLAQFPEFSGVVVQTVTPGVMTAPTSTAYASPAAEQVSGPATGLLVTAILGFVGQSLAFMGNLFGISQGFVTSRPPEAAMNFFSGSIGMVFNGIGVVIGILVLIGALKMKKLESYDWAMASSILALIPCVSPCCLVGLPIGIWSLVVLSKPEVKASFH